MAKEGKERCTEHVVSPRPPEALEVLAKDRHHAIGDKLALTWVVALEDVEPDRALARRRIEQDDAIRVLGWDALEHVADKVAFGIDDTDSDAGLDVLKSEIEEQRALARTGRTDCMKVVAPVGLA